MTARTAALVWLVVGLAIWNVIFDLHVLYGARDYLYLAAEAELGRADPPSMADIMRHTKWTGALTASGWTLLVLAAGWATYRWRPGTPQRPPV